LVTLSALEEHPIRLFKKTENEDALLNQVSPLLSVLVAAHALAS